MTCRIFGTAGLAACWLLAAVGVGPGTAGAQSSDAEAFLRGNRLYESGDFQGAIAAYEEILGRGRSAAELEYNLANAYLKVGTVGSAILHYRRALRARPVYENALENLNYARSLTQDIKIAEGGDQRLSWVGRIRLGPSRAAFFLWLSVSLVATLGGWRFRKGRLPGWATVGQWGLAALALLLAGALLFEWSQLEGRRDGVILAEEADVRSGPALENTLSFRLHEGTEVEILRKVPGWLEIKVSSELQGWVPSETLGEIE